MLNFRGTLRVRFYLWRNSLIRFAHKWFLPWLAYFVQGKSQNMAPPSTVARKQNSLLSKQNLPFNWEILFTTVLGGRLGVSSLSIVLLSVANTKWLLPGLADKHYDTLRLVYRLRLSSLSA